MPSILGISRSIRTERADQVYGFLPIGGLANDLKLRVERQKVPEAVPHDLMIVSNQNPNRHHGPPAERRRSFKGSRPGGFGSLDRSTVTVANLPGTQMTISRCIVRYAERKIMNCWFMWRTER
jgi:hypothetical protein